MPIFNAKVPKYKQPKNVSFQWDQFRGGLNTLLRPTELKPNELSQMDNLWLTGSGVPTKRPGTSNFFMGNATGNPNLVKGVYFKDGTNELLTITGGIATKKSNASYSIITGASFASGTNSQAVMIRNNLYLVNETDKITKYDSSSLTRFNQLAIPVPGGATFASGVSSNGQADFERVKTYSYRITALSPIGETLGSVRASLISGPQDPTDTLTRITWAAVSAASGDLVGYQIYGRDPGSETFIAKVGAEINQYEDDGTLSPSLLTEPPTADTTDGPIAKYIIKFGDKIILSGINDEPSRIMWSGGGPNVEKFHWSFGGGFVDVAKDDGDMVKGIFSFQNKILVFKERSIWQVTLAASGGIVVPTVKVITSSHGCVNHRTIRAVENDIFFLSRNGVYVLGNEPNIIGDILRTNELSAKIRPTIDTFNDAQISKAVAIYWKFKYIISYPASSQAKNTKMIVYDRERLSWAGPWNIGAQGFEIYFDSDNNERMLYGDTDDEFITELSESYGDDKAVAIPTFLRTRKEDFKDWSLFKTIQDIFFNFRNVLGSIAVNIRLEGRTGETTTVKSFSVSSQEGTAGFGTDQFGTAVFGLSENLAGSALNDTIRQSKLVKTARAVQIEIQTSNRNDSYELIGIRGDARIKSAGARPSSWRV